MKKYTFVLTVWFLSQSYAFATVPLWSFQALSSTSVELGPNAKATVQYRVTNNSKKPHKLVMTKIKGVTQIVTGGNCPNPFPLAGSESCVLSLEVNGAQVVNVSGGPVVCQEGATLQCYQPSQAHILKIKKLPGPTYTVGGLVVGLEGTVVLQLNGKDDLTIESQGGHEEFTFPNGLQAGTEYEVTVKTQPAEGNCELSSHGDGTIGEENVTEVFVACY